MRFPSCGGSFLADCTVVFLGVAGFIVILGEVFARRFGFVTGKVIFNGAYRAFAARVPRLD